MTDKLMRYHAVPNIVFIGNQFTPNDFPGKVAFPAFSLKVVTHLRQQHRRVMHELIDIFGSLDRDQSGKVDKGELGKAFSQKLTGVETRAMIRDLDYNGDGLISSREFTEWWLAGRRGKRGASLLSKLISTRLSRPEVTTLMSDTLRDLSNQMLTQSRMKTHNV